MEVLADPQHEDHANVTDWVGGSFNPDVFDVAETSYRLRIAVATRHPGARGLSWGATSVEAPGAGADRRSI